MREKYESLPLATLRDLAKAREMTGISTLKKAELIEAMLEQDEKDKKMRCINVSSYKYFEWLWNTGGDGYRYTDRAWRE